MLHQPNRLRIMFPQLCFCCQNRQKKAAVGTAQDTGPSILAPLLHSSVFMYWRLPKHLLKCMVILMVETNNRVRAQVAWSPTGMSPGNAIKGLSHKLLERVKIISSLFKAANSLHTTKCIRILYETKYKWQRALTELRAARGVRWSTLQQGQLIAALLRVQWEKL